MTERAQDSPTILTNGGNSCNDLSELQLVQDCGFTSCVKSDHQYPHLLFAEQALEKHRESVPHDWCLQLVWWPGKEQKIR